MYSKQQASQIRQSFWTALGRYMLPVPDYWGEKINWLNYKTGVKHVFFRMDATKQQASIGIYLMHPNDNDRNFCYEQLVAMQPFFFETVQEHWNWQQQIFDEHGKAVCAVFTFIDGVNVFNQETWPQIISFLKPRIIALDAFWQIARPTFE
jgi:hypothetical protein